VGGGAEEEAAGQGRLSDAPCCAELRARAGQRPGSARSPTSYVLARHELGQVPLPLRRVGIAHQLVDAQVGVRRVAQPYRARRPAQLLHGHAVLSVPQPQPAVLARRRDAQQPKLPHRAPQVHVGREAVGAVDVLGVGGDRGPGPGAHALPEVVQRGGGGGGGRRAAGTVRRQLPAGGGPGQQVPSRQRLRDPPQHCPAGRCGLGVGSSRL
jgi:hypothetical protein